MASTGGICSDVRVEVHGKRLWFDVDGHGLDAVGGEMRPRPTVVLLHGGPGGFDHSYFKPDFSRLTDVAQVVYLDLPGHGRSDWGAAEDWSFDMAGDAVRAFCDVIGLDDPIVLGHSFGGQVAIAYASRHPDHPAGLLLQSTMAHFDLDRVVDGFRESAGAEIADIVRRSYLGDGTVAAEEWDRCWRLFGGWVPGALEKARIPRNDELNVVGGRLMLEIDLRPALSDVGCPTLISVGNLDPITPVWASEEMASALPDGLATLEVLESAGHFPWRDAPQPYWASVERFVNSLS